MAPPDIIFIKVRDNAAKLRKICEIIGMHFEQGERILVSAPNLEAAQYVDTLLWKFPEDSFLPHGILNSPSEERIGITVAQENYNRAAVLFNLCPHANPIYSQFKTVYELYDETHPGKAEQSRMKLCAYPASRIVE